MGTFVVRLTLTIGVFLVVWGALSALGALGVIEHKKVVDWLTEQLGIQMLQERFREPLQALLLERWKVITAVVMGGLGYLELGGWAQRIVEWLKREPALRFTLPPSSSDELEFQSRSSPYLGAEEEVHQLEEFLSSKERLSWWWLVGPPGVGKSRLALEWLYGLQARRTPFLRARYDVSFLQAAPGRQPFDAQKLELWKPRRDTVLVIDDAAYQAQMVQQLLGILGTRAGGYRHRVRILLVERYVSPALAVLNEQELFMHCRYLRQPLEVRPLDEARFLKFVDRFESTLARKALPETDEVRQAHLEQLREVSEGIPLLLMAALKSMAEHGEVRWDGPESVLRDELDRLRGKFVNAGLTGEHLDLLALATVRRALPVEEAQRFLGARNLPDKSLLDRLLGADSSDKLPPLKPDLLGELFVLDQYERMTGPERTRFREAIWQGEELLAGIWLTGARRDFRRHPVLADFDQPPAGFLPAISWSAGLSWSLRYEDLAPPDVEGYWRRIEEVSARYDVHLLSLVLITAADGVIRQTQDGNLVARAMERLRTLMDETAPHEDEELQAEYEDLQAELAETLVVAAAFHVHREEMKSVEDVLANLETLSSRWQKNPRIGEALSSALWLVLTGEAKERVGAHADGYRQRLRALAERFPEELHLQLNHLKAEVNAVPEYAAAGRLEEVVRLVEQLPSLSRRFPSEAEVQTLGISGMAQAVSALIEHGHEAQARKALEQLEATLRMNGLTSMQRLIATAGLYNALAALGRAGRLDEMVALFDELAREVIRAPEERSLCILGRAGRHAVFHACKAGQLQVGVRFSELLVEAAMSSVAPEELIDHTANCVAMVSDCLELSYSYSPKPFHSLERIPPQDQQRLLDKFESLASHGHDLGRFLEQRIQAAYRLVLAFTLNDQTIEAAHAWKRLRPLLAQAPPDSDDGLLRFIVAEELTSRLQVDEQWRRARRVIRSLPDGKERVSLEARNWASRVLNRPSRRTLWAARRMYHRARRRDPSCEEALHGEALTHLAQAELLPKHKRLPHLQTAAKQLSRLLEHASEELRFHVRNSLGYVLMSESSLVAPEEGARLLDDAEKLFLNADQEVPGCSTYNLACVRALRGDEEGCAKYLHLARERGVLPSAEKLMRDEDLTNVRHRPWFQELLDGRTGVSASA